MNAYGVIVLAALLAEFAISLVADILNLRALSSGLPAEFSKVHDPDSYRKSQAYTRARARFGLWPRSIELLALLGFWFAGGFAWLDQGVRRFGLGPVATGLIYIGVLLAARALLALPFSAIATFVIEERFGFNRTTVATFITDRLKALALGLLLGVPLLGGILWFLETTGAAAWLYCWLIATLFILFVQLVAPTWIMPLFNRFTPLEDEELRAALLAYAQSVKFPLEQIFVMDGSKRSSKANAFFTGFGKRRRIALFDTLLGKHPQQEVVAVVAHEIGHYRHGHIKRGMVIAILHAGIMFALLSLVLDRDGLFSAFGLAEPSTYVGLVLFGLLYTPVEVVLSIALNALSRRQERQADRFSATTTGAAEPLVRALQRLSADSLSNLTPHPLYVALHYGHPPVLERIRLLRGLSLGPSPTRPHDSAATAPS